MERVTVMLVRVTVMDGYDGIIGGVGMGYGVIMVVFIRVTVT